MIVFLHFFPLARDQEKWFSKQKGFQRFVGGIDWKSHVAFVGGY
jgi:hypothetical protein